MPWARDHQVTHHREPEHGHDDDHHVVLLGVEFGTEERRRLHTGEAVSAAGLATEDRQYVRYQQNQEERRHRQGPVAQAQTGNTGQDSDRQCHCSGGSKLKQNVGVTCLGHQTRGVGTGRVHRCLAECQFTGKAEAQVQATDHKCQDAGQLNLT